MITRGAFAGVTAVLVLASTAAAQPSLFEVSGGYQIIRAADQAFPVGWSIDIGANPTDTWGIVGEVSGAYRVVGDRDLDTDVNLSLHSVGAGTRWSRRGSGRIVSFLQMLAGVTRVTASADVLRHEVGDSSTAFMLQPGGGVSVRLNGRLGLVGQADYRRVFFDDSDGEPGENQLRVLLSIRMSL
jgi:hypothetical protein